MSRVLARDEAATHAFGAGLAEALARRATEDPLPFVIFLSGDLGAGKTTLVRAILRALGVDGAVRSPTYTLMERYPLPQGSALHMDLYRLGDPEELEFLGLRDDPAPGEIMLVEWPGQGERHLPAPDLCIELAADESPGEDAGAPTQRRWLDVTARSDRGAAMLTAWSP